MTDERKIIRISPAQTPEEERHEISGCAEAEPFALRVIGDSMAPEFLDGHIVIIDPAMPVESGAYVIVDYAGETTFRQYVIEDGRRYLRALNASYPSVELEGEFRVRGVVVQRAGRRRREHKRYY
ncbi:repressor [Sulfurifustis variabilis]|uniref:Repressor n=1 Tax=Sulfurifustis variabilis TaxID=1675686 RepID=A0A1B4V1F6_9GAMM|nr:S24 family peptidase [Sulfurifustis variabilis]BAU47105.1 repressor [Sulfurifustis variabilis]